MIYQTKGNKPQANHRLGDFLKLMMEVNIFNLVPNQKKKKKNLKLKLISKLRKNTIRTSILEHNLSTNCTHIFGRTKEAKWKASDIALHYEYRVRK